MYNVYNVYNVYNIYITYIMYNINYKQNSVLKSDGN